MLVLRCNLQHPAPLWPLQGSTCLSRTLDYRRHHHLFRRCGPLLIFVYRCFHFWPDKGDAIYVELLPFLPERRKNVLRYQMTRHRISGYIPRILYFRYIPCCAWSPSIKNTWPAEALPRTTTNTGSVFWDSLNGDRNEIRDEKLSVLTVLSNS